MALPHPFHFDLENADTVLLVEVTSKANFIYQLLFDKHNYISSIIKETLFVLLLVIC